MSEDKIIKPPDADELKKFMMVLAGAVITIAAALGLAALLATPPFASFHLNSAGLVAGLVGTAPLLAFLWWFARTKIDAFAQFRQSQIEFFADIGFRFTPIRIALIALGAGVGEELLFRGVLQTWMAGFSPLMIAIVIPNILFGLLHWRTALYGIIAGVVGVYLGVLYALADNLLAPMLAHGLYDVVALEYTRRAVNALQNQQAV